MGLTTQDHLQLRGKAVIVTGAGSGIGHATVVRLAEEGAMIVGIDLSGEGLERTAQDVKATDTQFVAVVGDLSDLSVLDKAVDKAVSSFGGLYGLVNNAAIPGVRKAFEEVLPSEFEEMVAINLRAVWYAMKIAVSKMRAGGGGAIVNVASAAAKRPDPSLPLYAMTKAGVVALTSQAALVFAREKIRVNCICPGPVDTSMSARHLDQISQTHSVEINELRHRVARTTALGRFGQPAELAASICFLLGADASFITGASVPVDGGLMLK